MLEAVVLGSFIAGLLLCLVLGRSVVYALVLGLLLFIGYGLIKGHRLSAVLKMCLKGIKTISNILLVLLMIGALTGIWRACGTIPYIIYHAAGLITPQAFILAAFILSGFVSVLTGTAFGTAATMGVICTTMGTALGAAPLWTGGAVLAGCFFGDRCSPMSTSALLVAQLSGTSIFENIPMMIKTSLAPFAATCAVFLAAGFSEGAHGAAGDVVSLFAEHFSLLWYCVLPAAVIIIMSLFRIDVKITVAVSTLLGGVLCFAVQRQDIGTILQTALTGFKCEDAQLARMLSGGGITSMVSSVSIVCLTSCYSGIFEGTGLLDGAKSLVSRLASRITPFGGVLSAAIFTALISCNQALPIMLTHQLSSDAVPDNRKLAIYLENSAVVIPPLIPWSIAGAVPLATIGAPAAAVVCACYLYFIPLWNLALALFKRRHEKKAAVS